MKRQAKLHEVRPPSPIPPGEYWSSAEQNSEDKTIIYESIPRPQPTIPESSTIEEPPFPRPDSPSLDATVEANDTDSDSDDSSSCESNHSLHLWHSNAEHERRMKQLCELNDRLVSVHQGLTTLYGDSLHSFQSSQ
jgi:hypothetical protein